MFGNNSQLVWCPPRSWAPRAAAWKCLRFGVRFGGSFGVPGGGAWLWVLSSEPGGGEARVDVALARRSWEQLPGGDSPFPAPKTSWVRGEAVLRSRSGSGGKATPSNGAFVPYTPLVLILPALSECRGCRGAVPRPGGFWGGTQGAEPSPR